MRDMTTELLGEVSKAERMVLAVIYYVIIFFLLQLVVRSLPSFYLSDLFYDGMNIVLALAGGIALLYTGLLSLRKRQLSRRHKKSLPWLPIGAIFLGGDLLILALLALVALVLPVYAGFTNVILVIIAIPAILFVLGIFLLAAIKALDHLDDEVEEQEALLHARKAEHPKDTTTGQLKYLTRGEKVRAFSFLLVLALIVVSAIVIWLNMLYHFLNPILIWAILGAVYGLIYLSTGLRMLHIRRQKRHQIVWYCEHDILASLAGFCLCVFVLLVALLQRFQVDLTSWPVQLLNGVFLVLIAGLIIASSMQGDRERAEGIPALREKSRPAKG